MFLEWFSLALISGLEMVKRDCRVESAEIRIQNLFRPLSQIEESGTESKKGRMVAVFALTAWCIVVPVVELQPLVIIGACRWSRAVPNEVLRKELVVGLY